MPTLIDAFNAFKKTKGDQVKQETMIGYERYLYRCVPEWLNRDLTEIRSKDVIAKHRELTAVAHVQANAVIRLVGSLYNFSIEFYGLEDPEYAASLRNPVLCMKALNLWNKVKPRDSYMSKAQLRLWLHEIERRLTPLDRDFYLMLLLTGCRRSEMALLEWSDIDFDKEIITFPKTKNGRDHVIPLTRPALHILRTRRFQSHGSSFVFPSPEDPSAAYPWSRRHYESLEIILSFKCNPHCLRRTFATLAYTNGASKDLVSRMLNHTVGDVTSLYIQSHIEVLRPGFEIVAKCVNDCYEKPRVRLELPRDQVPA